MYSDLIVQHFTEPGFVGDLANFDMEFELGNAVCGDRIRIQAKLTNDVIEDIAFRAWGCATSVATADIFCHSVKSQSIDSIASRNHSEIELLLGELEPSQHHCVHILIELHRILTQESTVGES